MVRRLFACALSLVVIGGCWGKKEATTPAPEPTVEVPRTAPTTIYHGAKETPLPVSQGASASLPWERSRPSIVIPNRPKFDTDLHHTAMYAAFDATRDVAVHGKRYSEGMILQLLRPNHHISGNPKDGKWAMQPHREPRRIGLEIQEITPVASQYPLVWLAAPSSGRFPERFKIGWYRKGNKDKPDHLDVDRLWVNGVSFRTGTDGVVTRDDRKRSYIERKTFMIPVSQSATP